MRFLNCFKLYLKLLVIYIACAWTLCNANESIRQCPTTPNLPKLLETIQVDQVNPKLLADLQLLQEVVELKSELHHPRVKFGVLEMNGQDAQASSGEKYVFRTLIIASLSALLFAISQYDGKPPDKVDQYIAAGMMLAPYYISLTITWPLKGRLGVNQISHAIEEVTQLFIKQGAHERSQQPSPHLANAFFAQSTLAHILTFSQRTEYRRMIVKNLIDALKRNDFLAYDPNDHYQAEDVETLTKILIRHFAIDLIIQDLHGYERDRKMIRMIQNFLASSPVVTDREIDHMKHLYMDLNHRKALGSLDRNERLHLMRLKYVLEMRGAL